MIDPCVSLSLVPSKEAAEKTAQDIGFEICLILMHTAYALSSHPIPAAAEPRPTVIKTLKREKKLAPRGLA
jgi:hypothetical protein